MCNWKVRFHRKYRFPLREVEQVATGIAELLLKAGADTTILDDKFRADALGWAEYCKRPAIAKLIRFHRAKLGDLV